MTKGEAQDAVRDRDENRCTRCGMTDEQHRRTFGRSLHVHRCKPGSLYTVGGCVLLCCHCHNGEAKRSPGEPDAERALQHCMVRLPAEFHAEFHAALASLAKREGRALTWQLVRALNAHFLANGLPELPKPWVKG